MNNQTQKKEIKPLTPEKRNDEIYVPKNKNEVQDVTNEQNKRRSDPRTDQNEDSNQGQNINDETYEGEQQGRQDERV